MTSPLPHPAEIHKGAYLHFSRRVRERVGADADPVEHWWRVIIAVEAGKSDVMEFMGRLDRNGRTLFRYHLDDPRPFYVVFDRNAGCPITIMPNTRPLRCGSKGQRIIIDGIAYGL